MSRLLSVAILLALGFIPPPRAGAGAVPPSLLTDMRDEIAAGLKDMNRAAEAAARAVELATGGEDEVRQILGLVATHDPSVVDCGWVDSGGVLRWVEPAEWHAREGADLSGEESLRRIRLSGKPVLGAISRGPEEIDASVLAYPVVTAGGRLAGAVRMLFRPEPFLDRIIATRAANTGWQVWVVQTDGKILYAKDATLVGRSLISDESFRHSPEFVAIGRRVLGEPDGAAFPPNPIPATAEPPSWEGYWTSVPMNGLEWRILIARPAGGA